MYVGYFYKYTCAAYDCAPGTQWTSFEVCSKKIVFSDLFFMSHTKLWFILVKYKSHGFLFLVEKLLAFMYACEQHEYPSERLASFASKESKAALRSMGPCAVFTALYSFSKGYLSKLTKWVSFNIKLYPTHACVINLMHTNNHIWHR